MSARVTKALVGTKCAFVVIGTLFAVIALGTSNWRHISNTLPGISQIEKIGLWKTSISQSVAAGGVAVSFSLDLETKDVCDPGAYNAAIAKAKAGAKSHPIPAPTPAPVPTPPPGPCNKPGLTCVACTSQTGCNGKPTWYGPTKTCYGTIDECQNAAKAEGTSTYTDCYTAGEGSGCTNAPGYSPTQSPCYSASTTCAVCAAIPTTNAACKAINFAGTISFCPTTGECFDGASCGGGCSSECAWLAEGASSCPTPAPTPAPTAAPTAATARRLSSATDCSIHGGTQASCVSQPACQWVASACVAKPTPTPFPAPASGPGSGPVPAPSGGGGSVAAGCGKLKAAQGTMVLGFLVGLGASICAIILAINAPLTGADVAGMSANKFLIITSFLCGLAGFFTAIAIGQLDSWLGGFGATDIGSYNSTDEPGYSVVLAIVACCFFWGTCLGYIATIRRLRRIQMEQGTGNAMGLMGDGQGEWKQGGVSDQPYVGVGEYAPPR